jgi:hypothetical protein
MELIALCLFDHGPCGITDISTITCLPHAVIRDHLRLHRGTRYRATTDHVEGVPVRLWALLPMPTQELE